jgi:hypothetical protein
MRKRQRIARKRLRQRPNLAITPCAMATITIGAIGRRLPRQHRPRLGAVVQLPPLVAKPLQRLRPAALVRRRLDRPHRDVSLI